MTASGMGFPLVESTLPSTNMYSPLPSDAIESPLLTMTEDEVDSQHRALAMLNTVNAGDSATRLSEGNSKRRGRTIWCILGEERTQHAALRRVAHRWVVERVDKGRNSKDIGEEDEFLAKRCAGLASAGEELEGGHPFCCCDTVFKVRMGGDEHVRLLSFYGKGNWKERIDGLRE